MWCPPSGGPTDKLTVEAGRQTRLPDVASASVPSIELFVELPDLVKIPGLERGQVGLRPRCGKALLGVGRVELGQPRAQTLAVMAVGSRRWNQQGHTKMIAK